MNEKTSGAKSPITLRRVLTTAAVLILFALVFVAPAAAENWLDSADASWYSDTESSFTISSPAQLAGFAKKVNEGNKFVGKTIILGDNIDLTGKQWSPIGGDSVYFAGEFDGNGKTISGLTNTTNVARKGLFGLVEKCYIHDLTLKDVTFSGNVASARIGALAGNLQYYNVIKNVVVDGLDYDLTDTDGLIGGLVGYSWTSYVKDCVVKNADMTITSSAGSAVGGMIAYGRGVGDTRTNFPYADKINADDYQGDSVWNYVDSSVENLKVSLSGTTDFGGFLGADTYNHWRNYAKGNTVTGLDVTCAAGTGVYTVGGFMGGQYGGYDPSALQDNTVSGKIISQGTNTASTFGGFIGYKGGRPGGVTDCEADVDIDVSAGDIGGFVGETQQYFAHAYEFDNCVAKGDVSTDDGTAGAFAGNIQHGGDGSALNVVVTESEAHGTVTGTTASSFIGYVDDDKKGTATGGTVVVKDSTPTSAEVKDTNGNLITTTIGISSSSTLEVKIESGDRIMATLVSTQAQFEAAISAAKTGEKTVIELADGTYTMPDSIRDKEITFKGGKNAVIEMLTAINASGSTITFEGVTVKFDNDGYEGLQHSTKVVYEDCTHIGTQFMYAPTVVFEGCIFEMFDENTEYSVWTYGASDVTFTDCTFNTNGKAVLVYIEAAHEASIVLNDCTFTSTGKFDDKAAVEVSQSAYGNKAKYDIVVNNCKAEGFAENKISESTLVGNKNTMASTDLSVKVDGVEKNIDYTITFDTNGGTEIAPITGVFGSEVTVQDPTKDGYTFKGWEPTLPPNMPADDMTLTAVWVMTVIVGQDTYTVSTIDDQIYTGAEIRPDVTVTKSDGTTLTSGYTVAYSNNIGVGTAKATVTIEGATSTVEMPFAILKDENPTVSMADVSVTYGQDYTMTATAKTWNGTPISDAVFTIKYYTNAACTQGETMVKPTAVGIYYANATLTGTNNYAEAYYHAKITITEADSTDEVGITVICIHPSPSQGYSMGVNFVSAANKTKLEEKAAQFTDYSFIYADISLLKADGSKDSDTQATFRIGYPTAWGINANNYLNYNFVVLHLKGGEVEVVSATATADGLTVTSKLSPFAIGYSVKQTTGGSSYTQGSSVWLTEPQTPTETPEQPTEKPTDSVPTDISTTQPPQTETQSPLSVLAVLAGLGAVAVLRRK